MAWISHTPQKRSKAAKGCITKPQQAANTDLQEVARIVIQRPQQTSRVCTTSFQQLPRHCNTNPPATAVICTHRLCGFCCIFVYNGSWVYCLEKEVADEAATKLRARR